MKDLRGIIVNATTEMLDEPGDHGIYKTARFYDRLEREVTEYFEAQPTGPAAIHQLLLETVRNSQHLHPEMQKVIARYMDYQSAPRISHNVIKSKLFGEDIE